MTTTLKATYTIDIENVTTIARDTPITNARTTQAFISPLSEVPTGIPSSIPHVFTPFGGAPAQPAGTSLVQIGFLYPLSYPFVLANSLSQRQIFKYIVNIISYGLQIPEANITVQSLRAYDTTKDLHYISTLVLFYMPSDHINELSLQLHAPVGILYNNTDRSVKTLASMINPQLPFMADDSYSADEETNIDASTGATVPSPTATALASLSSGLPTRSKIAIGVVIRTGIVTLLLMGIFFWRRRKHVRHQPVKPTAAEKGDETVHELAPDSRRFELQVGDHDLELPTEGRERFEVQGDLRRRQELSGSEVAQELGSSLSL